MTLHRIRNLQSAVNLAGYVLLAVFAFGHWLNTATNRTSQMLAVVLRGSQKQIPLQASAGNIPNLLGPCFLVGLVVGVIKAIGVRCRAKFGFNQSRASDVSIHCESPNSCELNTLTIANYSAHARLFFSRSAAWAFLLGKSQQTSSQDNPIPAHLAGLESPLSAELQYTLLGHSKDCGGFCRRADHIKCGPFHAGQFTPGVAA